MRKSVIIFIAIVFTITAYGVLSTDHYFKINDIKKQITLAQDGIQNAQNSRQKSYNDMLDYYADYVSNPVKPVSFTSKKFNDAGICETSMSNSKEIFEILNALNIQDVRYQEIQMELLKFDENLDTAILHYNELIETYNEKIASPFFIVVNQIFHYEKATSFLIEK